RSAREDLAIGAQEQRPDPGLLGLVERDPDVARQLVAEQVERRRVERDDPDIAVALEAGLVSHRESPWPRLRARPALRAAVEPAAAAGRPRSAGSHGRGSGR